MDSRAPVIVGVGQIKQQLDDVSTAREQYLLMEEAVRIASADAGAPALLSSIDRLLVIGGLWRYPDPGALIAAAVGSPDAATYLTAMGGNMPQYVVGDAAERIQAGEIDVVVVAGGEAVYSKNKLRKQGIELARSGSDLAPASRFGADVSMSSDHERERGFTTPTEIYPLFESALRHAREETHAENRQRISQLWAGLNEVAVANPHAWVRTPMDANAIATPTSSNRMVGYPYTKAMNANSFVDHGGAIIMCSAGKAESLGISRDRWVFPQAATNGHATLLFSERDTFHESPAIRETGLRCMALAGVDADDLGPIDLYSCFPSVVAITMAELAITADRVVSTTGGLSFFGGPMNSYVLHAIASTVDQIREGGAPGFVHANGGYATKHSCAVYASSPPSAGFRRQDVQDAIDQYPTRAVDETPEGSATLESYTVLHGRGGAESALITAIMPDGRRALGSTTDEATMSDMTQREYVGRSVTLARSGTVTSFA